MASIVGSGETVQQKSSSTKALKSRRPVSSDPTDWPEGLQGWFCSGLTLLILAFNDRSLQNRINVPKRQRREKGRNQHEQQKSRFPYRYFCGLQEHWLAYNYFKYRQCLTTVFLTVSLGENVNYWKSLKTLTKGFHASCLDVNRRKREDIYLMTVGNSSAE